MEHNSLPSPPLEDQQKSHAKKRSSSSAKSTKPAHRTSKRSSTTTTTHAHLHSPISNDSHSTHSMADGRHKRVWKACERCRMKKTKVNPHHRPALPRGYTYIPKPVRCQVTDIEGSVTENSHVKDARTMVWYAQQAHERRQNLSNCHEGTLSPPHSVSPIYTYMFIYVHNYMCGYVYMCKDTYTRVYDISSNTHKEATGMPRY